MGNRTCSFRKTDAARQCLRVAGAKRVDVQATAPRVAGVNRQLRGLAASPHVHEDALHTVLMKLVVIAKAHQVLQQPRLLDLWSAVADAYAAPVGLTGDQAVAFQQLAGQGFGHGLLVEVRVQQMRRRLVVAAFDVQTVQTQAIQFMHGLTVELLGQQQLHAHCRGWGHRAKWPRSNRCAAAAPPRQRWRCGCC